MNQPNKPTLGEPQTHHEHDEDGNAYNPSVIWDLSIGCTASIGYENGQLVALVSTSDEDKRTGITKRTVTHEQVAHYAHQLLALGNEEYRTALQGLYGIASKLGVDPKWSDGAQDLIGRIEMLGIEPLQRRAIAAEDQLGDIRHALAGEGFCAPDTDEWTSLANIRARIQDLVDRAEQAGNPDIRDLAYRTMRNQRDEAIARANDAVADNRKLAENASHFCDLAERYHQRTVTEHDVERVARALMRVQHSGCLTWEDESDELRGHLTDQARAAIEALGGGDGA